MYNKIVEYDVKNPFGDMNEYKLIKEIEPTKNDLLHSTFIINGKTYRGRACCPDEGILAVEAIQLIDKPEYDIRSVGGLKCPYCQFVEVDSFELDEHEGPTTVCGCCNSRIIYVRNVVMNTLGECKEVIYYSSPFKFKEPIKF
ncbi:MULTISPECIES: hypothetical protein [Bacillus cereus group]|uniref:Uncharacterized protein n=1 Tax=Bacillus cereus (strain G9842) TaxID=405531 RepID=B7IZA2_BACC2|nr:MULTISPECIES: hypothetical protein [Bacillus cereus group]ACK98512.1 hypothetical protein BCG9842_0079 [Bacillus cereus G9842]MDR4137399.1 hypothetical protein [Bacillus cereus]MDR4368839.1 hypothetical protein [Bacillus cereus]PEE63282.1 hypothetical protein COM74_19415 [Bacillus thuringiensis]